MPENHNPQLPFDIEAASSILLNAVLDGGDRVRRLIGLAGWERPGLALPNFEMVDGNIVLWSNVKPKIIVKGTGNLIVFGKVTRGRLTGAIQGSGNVCYIGGQADIISLRADFTGNGSFLYVGSRTKIVEAHFVLGAADPPTSLLIGARSMLSSRVSLRATDSHGMIDLESEKILNPPSSIVIEPHVWIGESVSVLKGARIGAGSIVGAGALVTSTIPPRVACAGVPAKVIRTGVSWTNKPNPSVADIRWQKRFLDTVSPPSDPGLG